ncbi:MAG: DNA-processing protein DprA [Clostridiales bacterium]|jgi:DNA processing protein|nr:DNA-processing protein DprA [Clostridiales bacterium]
MITHTPNDAALLFLNSIEGVTQKKILEMIEIASEPARIVNSFASFAAEFTRILGAAVFHLVESLNNDAYKESLRRELIAADAEYITFLSEDYPESLREIPDFPILLFYRGDIGILKNELFSIVGTRTPTAYGRRVTKEFASELARAGFTIVSGMARGVDTAAHRAALDNNMPTVAVCGTGIDVIYPAENRALSDEIVKNGLILTEYKPRTRAMSYHFPHRNRIISALSKSVLVTEAGEKSGSLITVNYAVEQGKNIYIVPGSIYSPESQGANRFLKKLQAAMVTEINDILEDNNLERKEKADSGIILDIVETLIVGELSKGELHFDELLSLTGLEIGKLNSILTSLILMGQIEETGNNYYAAC